MDEIDSIGSSRIESGGGGDSGTVPDFYILEAKTNRKLVRGSMAYRIRSWRQLLLYFRFFYEMFEIFFIQSNGDD